MSYRAGLAADLQENGQGHHRRENRKSCGAVQMSRSRLFIARCMNSAYPNKVTKSSPIAGSPRFPKVHF